MTRVHRIPGRDQASVHGVHNVSPGQYYATTKNEVITTLLGSCVCACLKDPYVGAAGMNHFMLPEPVQKSKLFMSDAGRYGINAMELLINKLMKLGAEKSRLWAKVFGGANVLALFGHNDRLPKSNGEFVVRFLEAEKIPIIAKDLGGIFGRKVIFHASSGEVYIRRIRNIGRDAEVKAPARRPSVILFDESNEKK